MDAMESENKNRPMKRICDSEDFIGEIVGEESLAGQRMQAGALLDLMDILAGRVSSRHAASSVATVAVDEVDLVHPVFHQDLVKLIGKLTFVGTSSMVVKVQAFRQDLSRSFTLVQTSFVTMVAIDSQGKPNKNIPGLLYENQEEEELRKEALRRKDLTTQWLQLQSLEHAKELKKEQIEDEENKTKKEFLTSDETEICVKKVFFPKHLNINNTIFGGDILLWMDRVATHCARNFTRDRNMFVVFMDRIFFKHPVFTTDWVEMKARVIFVKKYVLEIEIAVTLERRDGTRVNSHSGYFTVLNFNEAGFKREILTGLKLSNEDPEGLKRYLKAKQRYEFWRNNKKDRSQSFSSPLDPTLERI